MIPVATHRFDVYEDFLKYLKHLYIDKSLNDIRWYYMGLCNPISLDVPRWSGHITCNGHNSVVFILGFNLG